jgi:adenylyltransferase/sulfurtransferase
MAETLRDRGEGLDSLRTENLLDGRYSRQVLFPGIGRAGQRRLMAARVLIVGCGALGTALANTLVRGGIGTVRIVDRDVVEESNLQRQMLFTTEDVRSDLPKAEAARRHLQAINPHVAIEAFVRDVDASNIESLMQDTDLVLDGSDNFEVRYLINDACVKHGRPWIYGGVLGSSGMCASFVPGTTGCLRCLFPEPPEPGAAGSCDTAGVLGTVVQLVAGLQATRALQILCAGDRTDLHTLITVDLWSPHFSIIRPPRLETCPTCVRQDFVYLREKRGTHAFSLCGRNAFQLRSREKQPLDLAAIADRLQTLGDVSRNAYLMKFRREGICLTLFADGRAIVDGAETAMKAREIYHQYLG